MRQRNFLLFPVLVMLTVSGLPALADDGPVHKTILGLTERARLVDLDISLDAKLDTGAVSASLSAYDVKTFERDGDDWVRFRIGADGLNDEYRELPLDDTVRIRRRLADIDEDARSYTERPVVRLMVCIGDRQVPMRVNLTDRRNFSYPLLVGAEGLTDLRAIIDPSEDASAGAPACDMTLGEVDEDEGTDGNAGGNDD